MKKYLLILVGLFIFLIPGNIYALTYGDVLDDLAEAQAELDAHNRKINNIDDKIDYDNATIRNLRDEITKMGEEVVKLQQEIADANVEIENKKEETKQLFQYLQLSGGENIYLEYIFDSDSVTDFIYRVAVVEQITTYNDDLVKELNDKINANEKRKVDLANKQEEYSKRMEQLDSEIQKLSGDKSALQESSPSLASQVKSKKELVNYYKNQGCKNRSDRIGIDCAVTASNGTFARPIKVGYVTSFVNYRWGSFHRGLDMSSSTGSSTPIYSIGNGVITSIYKDVYGALCIIVQYKTTSGKYYSALYAHLSRYASGLYVGKQVYTDTLLGYMGNTGYSFGVHLHLEVYPCRIYVDNECKTWNKYVSFAENQFKNGYKGASSVISFPSRTYTTWYSR